MTLRAERDKFLKLTVSQIFPAFKKWVDGLHKSAFDSFEVHVDKQFVERESKLNEMFNKIEQLINRINLLKTQTTNVSAVENEIADLRERQMKLVETAVAMETEIKAERDAMFSNQESILAYLSQWLELLYTGRRRNLEKEVTKILARTDKDPLGWITVYLECLLRLQEQINRLELCGIFPQSAKLKEDVFVYEWAYAFARRLFQHGFFQHHVKHCEMYHLCLETGELCLLQHPEHQQAPDTKICDEIALNTILLAAIEQLSEEEEQEQKLPEERKPEGDDKLMRIEQQQQSLLETIQLLTPTLTSEVQQVLKTCQDEFEVLKKRLSYIESMQGLLSKKNTPAPETVSVRVRPLSRASADPEMVSLNQQIEKKMEEESERERKTLSQIEEEVEDGHSTTTAKNPLSFTASRPLLGKSIFFGRSSSLHQMGGGMPTSSETVYVSRQE